MSIIKKLDCDECDVIYHRSFCGQCIYSTAVFSTPRLRLAYKSVLVCRRPQRMKNKIK